MSFSHKRVCWIDCETTGLERLRVACPDAAEAGNPNKLTMLLEVACVITDLDFNEVAVFERVVQADPEAIAPLMNEFCIKMHTESGLLEACRVSPFSQRQVGQELLEFIRQHTDGKCAVGGNSVAFDVAVLDQAVPGFRDVVSYRIIDVSSNWVQRDLWASECGIDRGAAQKWPVPHRALPDIRSSIDQLRCMMKKITELKRLAWITVSNDMKAQQSKRARQD